MAIVVAGRVRRAARRRPVRQRRCRATRSRSRWPPATRSGWSCSALAAGAVAFALAPFVGRGSAAGVAGAVMFGGFILNGYQAAIPALAPLANLTWFGWTSNHIPLAGQFDWVVAAPGRGRRGRPVRRRRRGVRPTRHRRDDRRSRRRACRGPSSACSGRPAGRSARTCRRRSPGASGIGLFGLAIAGSGKSFIDELGKSTGLREAAQPGLPGLRHPIASAGSSSCSSSSSA